MFGNDWDIYLKEEINKDYFKNLMKKIDKLYIDKVIYPKKEDLFKALKYTSYKDTKIVILGQDPYHEENQAEGLAFSVKKGVKVPPSLKNIFKELHDDLNINEPDNGSLIKWSKEGILLLNTILTVEENKALSHKNIGWEIFTDTIIKKLNERKEPVVFILWGSQSIKKEELITNKNHLIIKSTHPSPLSAYRGFLGSKPFSKANEFLIKNKIKPVNFDLN